MYDTVIIGSGPAGFTAGIYASRREMKTLVIGKEIGGQLIWASEIENYPGFRSIQSFELIQKMKDHVTDLGVEIKNEEVVEVKKQDDGTFEVKTGVQVYKAKTVITTIGLTPRRLNVKGEKRLNGKGVTYCANCDAPFFKNKTVAVVGGGNSALDAAEILSKIAAKVYLIHRSENFKAFDVLVDEVKSKDNIEIILNSDVEEIMGENRVEKIKIKNKKESKDQVVDIDGIFIEIGRVASTELVESLVERDTRGQILVDEYCKTSCKGLFAAGDVTQVPFKQISIACGQATIAALAAYEYIRGDK